MPLLLVGTGSPAAVLDVQAAALLRAGLACAAGSAIGVDAVLLSSWMPVMLLPLAAASPSSAAASAFPSSSSQPAIAGSVTEFNGTLYVAPSSFPPNEAANAPLGQAADVQRAVACTAVSAGSAARPTDSTALAAPRKALLLVVSMTATVPVDDVSSEPADLMAGRRYTLESVMFWATARASAVAAADSAAADDSGSGSDAARTPTAPRALPSAASGIAALDLAALRALLPLLAALRPHFLHTTTSLSHTGSFDTTAVRAAVDAAQVANSSIAYAALGPWLQALAAVQGGRSELFVVLPDGVTEPAPGPGPLPPPPEPLPVDLAPGAAGAEGSSFPLIPSIAIIGGCLLVGTSVSFAVAFRRRRRQKERKDVHAAPHGQVGRSVNEPHKHRVVNPTWAASHFRVPRQPSRRVVESTSTAAEAIAAAVMRSGAAAEQDSDSGADGVAVAANVGGRTLHSKPSAAHIPGHLILDDDYDAAAAATGLGDGASDDDSENSGDTTPELDSDGHVVNDDAEAMEDSPVFTPSRSGGHSGPSSTRVLRTPAERVAAMRRSGSAFGAASSADGRKAAAPAAASATDDRSHNGVVDADGEHGRAMHRSRSFVVEVGAMLSRGASYLRGLASRQNSYFSLQVANPDDPGVGLDDLDGSPAAEATRAAAAGGRPRKGSDKGSVQEWGLPSASTRRGGLKSSGSPAFRAPASSSAAAGPHRSVGGSHTPAGAAGAPPTLRGPGIRGTRAYRSEPAGGGDGMSGAPGSGGPPPSLLVASRGSSAASVFNVDVATGGHHHNYDHDDHDDADIVSVVEEWGASPAPRSRRGSGTGTGTGSRSIPRNASAPTPTPGSRGAAGASGNHAALKGSGGFGSGVGFGPQKAGGFGFGPSGSGPSAAAAALSKRASSPNARAAGRPLERVRSAIGIEFVPRTAGTGAASADKFASSVSAAASGFAAPTGFPMRISRPNVGRAAGAVPASAPGIRRIVAPPSVLIAEADDEYAGDATPMTEADIEDLVHSLAAPAPQRARSALAPAGAR